MKNLYKIYLSKLFIGCFQGTTAYEAIERCKAKHWQYNTQLNICLWKAKLYEI